MQTIEPRIRRWTRSEYYQMADLGWFQGQRVELIDGEIIEMSPQGHPHVVSISLVERALRSAFGDGFWIRIQSPLRLTSDSEPEPDVAVVPGSPRDYADHPDSALLIVEVSDTMLSFDSQSKARVYAAAGIPEYWIVNLIKKRLEIYRAPTADPASPSGYRYADVATFQSTDGVTPLKCPQVQIVVADMLP